MWLVKNVENLPQGFSQSRVEVFQQLRYVGNFSADNYHKKTIKANFVFPNEELKSFSS
jgi:hypothetical protein